ncbi:hypothetical protein QZH41_010829 [Actinostola sp. cb2023]|nr:hypothetical protein QZH41_010829 [Actinostola sp. cb2023]
MDGINPKAKLIDNEVITDYPSPSEHEIRKNVVSSLVGDGGNLKRTTLSWKGIDVFASIGRGSICKRLCSKGSTDEPKIKQLLFDVTGKVEPGTLLAVMGARALLRMEKHVSRKDRLAKVEEVLQEVLTDPGILFADEPTSGLDSFMAQSVVSTLQRLASQGRTIVCTIHQPSSEVYAMFSSVMLMAEGRVAFLGSSSKAISYFDELGFTCPSNFNPADYFIQLLAIVPGQASGCRERIKKICDTFAEQSKAEDDIRDSREVTSLIAGLIYLQTPINTSGVQNLAGAIFFLVTSATFSSLQGVIFVFPAELPVFIRDHKNGIYRTDVYFLSKTFAEVPIFIASPLILTTIAYWMIGLRAQVLPFVYAVVILTLLTNVAVSYGYIIASISSSVEGASALGPPLMLPLMLFGGFFLKDSTVPDYFIWIKYISWFRYGFELLIVNQWDGYGPISNCTVGHQTNLCIPNGDAAIDFLGLDKNNFMFDIYALLALFIGFRIIAFLLLLYRSSKTE